MLDVCNQVKGFALLRWLRGYRGQGRQAFCKPFNLGSLSPGQAGCDAASYPERSLNAARMRVHVSSRISGRTRVDATVDMKLVSPIQRGTT